MKFSYLRWMVRCAVLWIVLGALFGLVMFMGYRVPMLSWTLAWRASHFHAILVGGVIQMIAGVALWMFPRAPTEPQWPKAAQGWTLWTLFNAGTLLRCAISPSQFDSNVLYGVALTGAVLQTSAIVYFLSLVLPRVRAPRAM